MKMVKRLLKGNLSKWKAAHYSKPDNSNEKYILQDKVTQISAREVGFFNERRRRIFFSLCTVSTMMAEAKKSVAENFLDFLRGCSSIFGGWGVVLPERTGCQFRPPEGGSPLLPPPPSYTVNTKNILLLCTMLCL